MPSVVSAVKSGALIAELQRARCKRSSTACWSFRRAAAWPRDVLPQRRVPRVPFRSRTGSGARSGAHRSGCALSAATDSLARRRLTMDPPDFRRVDSGRRALSATMQGVPRADTEPRQSSAAWRKISAALASPRARVSVASTCATRIRCVNVGITSLSAAAVRDQSGCGDEESNDVGDLHVAVGPRCLPSSRILLPYAAPGSLVPTRSRSGRRRSTPTDLLDHGVLARAARNLQSAASRGRDRRQRDSCRPHRTHRAAWPVPRMHLTGVTSSAIASASSHRPASKNNSTRSPAASRRQA